MNKSHVAIVRCDTYDDDAVFEAVGEGLELLGGVRQFIAPGERIVLKPNVLAGDNPDKCVSPHPAVFKAVARHLQKTTTNLAYGDSPGVGRPQTALKNAGLESAADALGLEYADFEGGRETVFPGSPFTQKFVIANAVLEADGLVSLSKLKTHLLTRFTGAVKNQFGVVPGMLKKGFHIKMPDAHDFAKMLVALTLAVRPRLYAMDAVMAMEGNGPRGGTPAAVKTLLFSADPVALDAVACRLIDLDPANVPTMKPGRAWNLGTYLDDDIVLKGDALSALVNGDFKVDRRPFKSPYPRGMGALMKHLIANRPVIDEAKCVRCGLCVRTCPVTPKALEWRSKTEGNPPAYRYTRCIRCFCCQEICPEGAIYVKPSIFHPAGRKN